MAATGISNSAISPVILSEEESSNLKVNEEGYSINIKLDRYSFAITNTTVLQQVKAININTSTHRLAADITYWPHNKLKYVFSGNGDAIAIGAKRGAGSGKFSFKVYYNFKNGLIDPTYEPTTVYVRWNV